MRTGADYKESLRDGRKVYVMGAGGIEDITTHPATEGMVNEYVAWYDRHFDPEWQDLLLTPADAKAERRPVAFEVPETPEDFRRLGNSIIAQGFVGGGNVTHTPCYGAMIALGILDSVMTMGDNGGGRVAVTKAYRDDLAATGRFITLTGGATILGDRFRDPSERFDFRIVKESDAGIYVTGRTGMHTSTPFANDIYIGLNRPDLNQRAMFCVAVNSPGARVVARRAQARAESQFTSPLSSRFDELDAQLWLEEVFVPWEKVFAMDFGPTPHAETRYRERFWCYLGWHHVHSWLSRAEFSLGLALSLTDAIGLRDNQGILNQIVDLVVAVQTVRTCLTASWLEPIRAPSGLMCANPRHTAAAANYLFQVRQRISEIVRNLPGSSIVLAPTDEDFSNPAMAPHLERNFGGGGYTGRQRAALLNLAWDHTSSGLDGRESAFEQHASGGIANWRNKARIHYDRYNELANAVLKAIDEEMPPVDIEDLMRGPGMGPSWVQTGIRQTSASTPAPRPSAPDGEKPAPARA